jgi:hypothetical protein
MCLLVARSDQAGGYEMAWFIALESLLLYDEDELTYMMVVQSLRRLIRYVALQ